MFHGFFVFFFGLGRDVCQSPKCCPLWRYCSRPNNNSLMRWCCWIVMQEHARAAPDIEDPLVTPLALKGDSGWIANRLAIAKRTTPSSATWKREFANAKLISEVSIHFLLPFTALNYADRFPSGALPLRTLIFAVFDRPFYLLSCLRVSMIPLIPDGSLAAELCPSFSHFSPPAPGSLFMTAETVYQLIVDFERESRTSVSNYCRVLCELLPCSSHQLLATFVDSNLFSAHSHPLWQIM